MEVSLSCPWLGEDYADVLQLCCVNESDGIVSSGDVG